MRKLLFSVVLFLSFAGATRPAHADITGCVDSPENPTVLLALVGTAGAGAVVLRSRWSGRRRK